MRLEGQAAFSLTTDNVCRDRGTTGDRILFWEWALAFICATPYLFSHPHPCEVSGRGQMAGRRSQVVLSHPLLTGSQLLLEALPPQEEHMAGRLFCQSIFVDLGLSLINYLIINSCLLQNINLVVRMPRVTRNRSGCLNGPGFGTAGGDA